MILINCFAGPGAGKSTLAAGIFTELKMKKINCELVTEYPKDLVLEERWKTFEDQWYVSMKQLHRFNRLKNKIDIAVTDSPLLLGTIYKVEPNPYFLDALYWEFAQFDNVNIFVKRQDYYTGVGRRENLKESIALDIDVNNLKVDFHLTLDSSRKSIQTVTEYIMNKIHS